MKLSANLVNRPAAVPAPRPVWLSTSPHLQPRHLGDRAPWGTVHAVLDGSRTTACGLGRATWFVFWHLRFDGRRTGACRSCAMRIVELSRPVVTDA